jgi:hypothetical protein
MIGRNLFGVWFQPREASQGAGVEIHPVNLDDISSGDVDQSEAGFRILALAQIARRLDQDHF